MKKNRLISWFLTLFLILSLLAVPCYAETDASDAAEPTEAMTASDATDGTEAPTEASGSKPVASSAGTPSPLLEYGVEVDFQVSAKAAALIELNSNTLAYGYRMDEQIYPASLTKIMTCMLALQHGNLDDVLTVSETALQNLHEAGSSAGLQEGEQLSLRELLCCIMISSANEGCNVIAEYISGDVESFVALMNQQAAALGMTSTHFANAHGLHEEDHYTTVRDLAILARWAWQDEQFQEFSTMTSHTVPATNLSEERELRTTNYLISGQTVGKYYYEKARGIKTGFTTPAGGCLISTAEDGDLNFLSIICGCETVDNDDGTTTDERFTETKRMFEYGFEHFNYVQVLADTEMVDMPQVLYSDGRENVVVRAKSNVSVLLPDTCDTSGIELTVTYDKTPPLEAPLEAGEVVGTVTATLNGVALASCELVTLTAVDRSTPKYVAEQTGGFFAALWDGMWKHWYLTVPLLLILAFLITVLILRSINKRKAKKRAMRARRPGGRERHE